jgi:DNA-binding winged helix-turn-helix (wHTH) protein/TolB-like protein
VKGAAAQPHTYRFAGFELDLRSGELRKEGRRLRLPEQPFQVLRLLLGNPGEVVTREELRQKLWPGNNTFVDFDHGLNNAVNRLRELLNDSSERPRYIETIPRRGYRFIAPVDNAQSAVIQASVAGDFTQASQAVTAHETNRTGAAKTRPRKVWFTTAAVAIAGASLLFGLGLTWHGRREWRSTNVTPEQVVRVSASRQMVVLPFRPTAEDSSSRAVANGLTEALAAKLGQIADRYPLEIVSAAEARAQRVNDAQEARAVLGATLVLEGSLQESGSTMRVIYSLVDTRTLRQVHSGVITADASNPFAVQDRVIEEVLIGLDIELATQDRGRLQAHETAQPQAYDSYVRARGYLQEYDRSENLDSAIAALRRSLEVDPKFALAYAGLGQAYINRYTLTGEPKSVEDAKNACTRASELGGSSPDGEICIGMLFNATGEYEKAAQHLERAVGLDPGRDESYRELALAYEGSKRLDD